MGRTTETVVDNVTFTAASEGAAAKAQVENESGAALPSTGGPGTKMFTIFGSILVLFAGLLLTQKHRFI